MGYCGEKPVAIKMSHQIDVQGSFARPRSRILCLLSTTLRFYRLACFIWSTESFQNNPQKKVFAESTFTWASREEGEEVGLVSSYTSLGIYAVYDERRTTVIINIPPLFFFFFFFFFFCCFQFYSIKFIGWYKELLRIKLCLIKNKKRKKHGVREL